MSATTTVPPSRRTRSGARLQRMARLAAARAARIARRVPPTPDGVSPIGDAQDCVERAYLVLARYAGGGHSIDEVIWTCRAAEGIVKRLAAKARREARYAALIAAAGQRGRRAGAAYAPGAYDFATCALDEGEEPEEPSRDGVLRLASEHLSSRTTDDQGLDSPDHVLTDALVSAWEDGFVDGFRLAWEREAAR